MVQWTTDLIGGYSTYEEHYRMCIPLFLANESKYSQTDDDVDIDKNGQPKHLWNLHCTLHREQNTVFSRR